MGLPTSSTSLTRKLFEVWSNETAVNVWRMYMYIPNLYLLLLCSILVHACTHVQCMSVVYIIHGHVHVCVYA